MKDEQIHHQELIAGISRQMKSILDSSQQAVYIYLDDIHKVCNEKFASLLGYHSVEEWAEVEDPFPQVFVDPSSQEVLVNAYQQAMEKLTASNINVVWKKKSGGTVVTTVIMVPLAYDDHLFALHFIS